MLSQLNAAARGVVLLSALLWLMLLTVVVLGVGRLLRNEQRIGSNLDDAQLAFRLAETALQAGEAALPSLPQLAGLGAMPAVELRGPTSPFTLTCRQPRNPPPWQQGLCLSAALAGQAYPAPWQQRDASGLALLHPCGAARRVPLQPVSSGNYCPGVAPGPWYWADPHYLIELLDPHYPAPDGRGLLFRVTARGWGKQAGSVVTLQSHVLLRPEGSQGRQWQRLSWRLLP
jgi:type IV pilus assembly protein PilX